MCATKPKFLSSAPEIKSPIKDLLHPEYWHRPAAFAQRIMRVSGESAFVRLFFGLAAGVAAFFGIRRRPL